MIVRAVVFVALCAVPAIAEGQTVELVYTPGALHQAVSLKDALKVDVVHSSSALALVGAPAEKKKAYSDKVTGVTAVVIVGEDALKAVADVEFAAAVILVNANGPTAARDLLNRGLVLIVILRRQPPVGHAASGRRLHPHLQRPAALRRPRAEHARRRRSYRDLERYR